MNREILPNNIKPIKYNLEIIPNFTSFKFNGVLRFNFNVIEKTDKITLNSKELDIKSALIASDSDIKVKKTEFDEEKEWVTFSLNKKIGLGEYVLIVNYEGILNDQMAGFYRSKYTDSKGKDKYLGITQFEAVDARRALPCMDEPVHKAIFQITLIISKDLIGLSNTEIIYENIQDNIKTIKFAETPIMSTYLLAFFVGESDYTEAFATIGNKQIPVKVFTPIGESEKGVFARDLCVKVLEFFSEYFDIDYPLNKMDMIAIPDFAAGAMENWGLITYRSKYIMYDETTSIKAKIQLAYTICHELAHQWFGNLVTMSWWSGLWLNEGFATWVGWMAVDHFFPEWNVWHTFYLDEFLRAQQLDSLKNSHPIEVDIKKASQVDEIFDAISYSKGACIIAMLVNYLSEEIFQKGIIKYLKKYKYSNARTIDLWNILEEASNKHIFDLIENWTKYQGFPIINLEFKKDSIKLVQEQFNDKESLVNWNVPLNINKDGIIINLVMKEKSLEVHNFSTKWFKLNYGQNGFYIVNYDDKSLDKLKKHIIDKKIDILDRAGIINDLFILAQYGYIKLNKPLTFINNYFLEDNFIVLSVIIEKLSMIKSTWYDNEIVINKINEILGNLIVKSLDVLDYMPTKGEDHNISLKRNLILSVAIQLKIPKVLNVMTLLWKNNKDEIPADLRELVYLSIVKYGTEQDFNILLNIYQETKCSLEQNQILNSIGQTPSLKLIQKILNLTFEDNSIIRQQDIPFVIASVANNFQYRKYLWQFVKDNWTNICQKLKGGSFLFGRVISTSIKLLSSQIDLDDINKFISNNQKDFDSLTKTIEQAKETIVNKIDFKNRNLLNEFQEV